jgi:alkanesulfonate monooxygenase SsuD/methylene tetrahydromethanopterin reductase-like flavin-dependent oxidoreductase (luciferase family)
VTVSVEIGVFLNPDADALPQLREAVQVAEQAGFDYVSVQDHPYAGNHLDTFSLLAWLAGRTQRLRLITNVANLPLRPAPMLAKASASIDVLSAGRFVLGLGGGRAWPQIAALGGPVWTPPEVVAAVEEAVRVCRALRRPGTPVLLDGTRYAQAGTAAGPAPARPIPIWLGAAGPRMLTLLGRIADGWIAPLATPFESKPAAQRTIDAAATAAGRDPAAIRRVIQLVGTAAANAPYRMRPTRGDNRMPIRATPRNWAEIITEFVTEQRFDAVNLVLEHATPEQVALFGEEVIPEIRAGLAAAT